MGKNLWDRFIHRAEKGKEIIEIEIDNYKHHILFNSNKKEVQDLITTIWI